MKRTLLLALSLLLLGSMLEPQAAERPRQQAKASATAPRGALVHMVAFKFKPEATPEKTKEVEDAFRANAYPGYGKPRSR